MTLQEHSEKIGRCKNYFSVIKYGAEEDFKRYLEYGNGDLSKGFMDVEAELRVKIEDCTEIYFDLKETKGRKISEMFVKSNLDTFISEASHRKFINDTLFSSEGYKVNKFKKLKVLDNILKANIIT